MTVDTLRTYLAIGILIGKAVAPKTETTIDDKAVEVAEKLAANEALLAIVAAIFSGQPAPAPALNADEQATLDEFKANQSAVLALVSAAQEVC